MLFVYILFSDLEFFIFCVLWWFSHYSIHFMLDGFRVLRGANGLADVSVTLGFLGVCDRPCFTFSGVIGLVSGFYMISFLISFDINLSLFPTVDLVCVVGPFLHLSRPG